MGEDDLGHAGEVVVQKRLQHLGVERLDERREAGDVGEERRDLAALSAEIDGLAIRRQPFGEIGRKVARQRRVRALGGKLPAPRLAQDADMPDGLGDRRLEIDEVDRLRHEIERAAVHRRPDIRHVAVRGDDHGREVVVAFLELSEQGQPVHARHVDVAEHHVDVAVAVEHAQGLDAVAGEEEADAAIPDLPPELLQDQPFEVGLVVDDEDFRAHPTCPSRASISSRKAAKSIGFVSRDLAPPSSALRFVSSSP